MKPIAVVATCLAVLLIAFSVWHHRNPRRQEEQTAAPIPGAATPTLAPPPESQHPPAPPATVHEVPPHPPADPLLDTLTGLASSDLLKHRPEIPAQLAALIREHPGDEEWEAGAVAYLARHLPPEDLLNHWERAVDAFPSNRIVADACLRASLSGWTQETPNERTALVLERMAGRHPDWNLPSLLLAGVRMGQAKPEEAETLFLKVSTLPPAPERTGLSERGGFRIREAIDGPADPPEAFQELYGSPSIHVLGVRLRTIGQRFADRAAALEELGETARAAALLEAGSRSSRTLGEGTRILVTFLSCTAMERSALKRLQARAEATGDLQAADTARNRLQHLSHIGKAQKQWMKERDGLVLKRLQTMAETSGLTQTQDWDQAKPLLSRDDHAFLRGLVDDGLNRDEMQDFRAWMARQPGERP